MLPELPAISIKKNLAGKKHCSFLLLPTLLFVFPADAGAVGSGSIVYIIDWPHRAGLIPGL